MDNETFVYLSTTITTIHGWISGGWRQSSCTRATIWAYCAKSQLYILQTLHFHSQNRVGSTFVSFANGFGEQFSGDSLNTSYLLNLRKLFYFIFIASKKIDALFGRV
jgi:hypothetical protein